MMADEYAVKNSSKSTFINALNKILVDAPKSALKEVKVRIKYLETL